jgi:hypothetical protein
MPPRIVWLPPANREEKQGGRKRRRRREVTISFSKKMKKGQKHFQTASGRTFSGRR